MKKIFIYISMSIAALLLATSCEKDEIGEANTAAMAGEWIVTYAGLNATGDTIYYSDPRDYGEFHFDTYNVAANTSTEMWVNDNQNSWHFKNKVDVDLSTLTFSCDSTVEDYWGATVVITNGKILLDAATTPSGAVADSIVFDIWFSDEAYMGVYYDRARVSGYRYTGLTSDY